MKRYLAMFLGLTLLLGGASVVCASAGADTVNAAPSVLPAVREWTGGNGVFLLKNGMSVVLESESIISAAKKNIIADYFKSAANISITFKTGKAAAGDVYLCRSDDSNLGDEGYTLDAGDIVEIAAVSEQGLFYGIITLLQSHTADGYMPRGHVRDYPSYEIRSGMLDVARAYVPLDYVEEITKYFAWFKLNEIHLHINDTGSDGVGYFRLESDVPNLTSEEHYTKDEYRAYQKRMIEYGVEVVTEIDTPAHSTCFTRAVPQYMFDSYHIDITNPEAVQFICDLWDEYITGDDPVFVTKTVHFGTDEFTSGYNEQMRAYTDTLIKHITSRGYKTRFWGSFGGDGFNGTTPVSGNSQTNFWAVALSDYKTLFEMGYDVINSCGPVLYCVPGGNYGFADYYDLSRLYTSWFVNYMGYNASTSVAHDNPQLKGASFCLWNDLWCNWGGFSIYDIFDRVRYQVCLISEKSWTGEQTRQISSENFIERFDKLSLKAGDSDPGRHVELPITLENVEGLRSVGFPYYFSADVTVSKYGCDILSGQDGSVSVANNGKLCLKRGGYSFDLGYFMKLDTKTNIALYADNRRTLLIVDGKWFYDAVNTRNRAETMSTTFVLPLEKIGDENCTVSSLEVKKPDFSPNDLLYQTNLALGKSVTVSGLEVDYLNGPLAVDGDSGTRLSFARDKDEQWMIVDLGAVRSINKIIIEYFEQVSAYELYISTDGVDYIKVKEASGLEEGVKATETAEFDPVDARYVKYVQLKRWYCAPYSTWYSGGIVEFQVLSTGTDCSALIAEAVSIDDKDVKSALNNLKRYMNGASVYEPHIQGLCGLLEDAIDTYKNPPVSEEPSEVSVPAVSEESSQTVSGESKAPAKKDGGAPKWLIPVTAVGFAAAIAVAAVLIIRRRKKQ